ncbi:bifunctional DNA primase/polymerase [Nocardia sp. NPDC051750]|uniref:bifunctional DNA primase/polymerase n=1 Tax=Nocardia sp. NPDC051750 TaxID=3364325 RepID=UPI00379D5017
MPDPAVSLALGLTVFPVRGRAPAAPDWATTATDDPRQVRRWPAGCNPGIGCRANGLVILDIDRRCAVDGATTLSALCSAAGETLPATLTVGTPSGGTHLYFRAPAGRWIASGRLAAGVDVRGPGRRTGGYVLGPGAVVAGRRYTVTTAAPITALPEWLAQILPGRDMPMTHGRNRANCAQPKGKQ